MSTTNDHLIRQLKLQDAVLKREAEQSLSRYVRQAWSILEPDAPFLSNWHIEYVENISWRLDLVIIWETVCVVLRGVLRT